VLLLFDEFSANAWVGSDWGTAAVECVCGSRHELTLVVGASVANDDLRGVLVRHHDCGLRETTSLGVGVVGLKRLPGHASM